MYVKTHLIQLLYNVSILFHYHFLLSVTTTLSGTIIVKQIVMLNRWTSRLARKPGYLWRSFLWRREGKISSKLGKESKKVSHVAILKAKNKIGAHNVLYYCNRFDKHVNMYGFL